jgi:hypothetical protein
MDPVRHCRPYAIRQCARLPIERLIRIAEKFNCSGTSESLQAPKLSAQESRAKKSLDYWLQQQCFN